MQRSHLAVLGFLVTGCLADPGRDRSRALLVGDHDIESPEVGVLVAHFATGPGTRSTERCTATLVTDRVVITARHCVPDGAAACDVLFATSAEGIFDLAALSADGAGTARGQAIVRPRDVGADERMTAGIGTGMLRGDLLAIVLDRPLPLPEHGTLRGPPLGPTDAGSTVRIVGAGTSPSDGPGVRVRRTALERVGTIADGFFTSLPRREGSSIRPGDSGGPVLLVTGSGEKLLVGVVTAQMPYHSLHTVLSDWSGVVQEATDRAAAEPPSLCTSPWSAGAPGARRSRGTGAASDGAVPEPEACACDPACTELGDCCDGCWACACDDACGTAEVPCCAEGCT